MRAHELQVLSESSRQFLQDLWGLCGSFDVNASTAEIVPLPQKMCKTGIAARNFSESLDSSGSLNLDA
jgi:hypothetical protein